jgi:hypothetical protein
MYRLSTASIYYTSVTITYKLMSKDLKWWNTLRRCINKIVHAAYSKTTEATTLFSENFDFPQLEEEGAIFQQNGAAFPFQQLSAMCSKWCHSSLAAVLCYRIHEKGHCGPEISKHEIMACIKTITPQQQTVSHCYLLICQVPTDKLFPH